jgi:hypothetical protein
VLVCLCVCVYDGSEGTPLKRTITHRALLARINRALKAESKQVKRSRKDSRDFADLGAYYTVDFNRNAVTARNVDLAEYGKQLGLLEPYETLEKEN